jgi:hypothetical protein
LTDYPPDWDQERFQRVRASEERERRKQGKPDKLFIVAFPEREDDRARLRAILKPGDPPMPAKYPGAIVMSCHHCGMPLSVGPRSQQALLDGRGKLMCVECLAKETKGAEDVSISHLGNPDSKPEEEG